LGSGRAESRLLSVLCGIGDPGIEHHQFRRGLVGTTHDQLFAEWGQLGKVMSMLVPTAIYVALVPWIGIYVASMLLIAVFMRWLGRYGWGRIAAIAVGVPVVTFIIFEKWFLVPLPKGLIEELLGF
jgi:hypothetical protein